MADPGTAIGIISLGIQVCQGLTSYYSVYKSFHDHVNHANLRLGDLQATLEILQQLLPRLDPSSSSTVTNASRIHLAKMHITPQKDA